jgi:hypothetical protein
MGRCLHVPLLAFDANERMVELIDELKNSTDSASRAEAIRQAIKLYKIVTDIKQAGGRLGVLDEKGEVVKELIVP